MSCSDQPELQFGDTKLFFFFLYVCVCDGKHVLEKRETFSGRMRLLKTTKRSLEAILLRRGYETKTVKWVNM